MRQKTPHPKELKAKAHKLFGTKKGDSTQQNEEQFAEQNINNATEIENRNRGSETNGFGQSNIVFHEGVGTKTLSKILSKTGTSNPLHSCLFQLFASI